MLANRKTPRTARSVFGLLLCCLLLVQGTPVQPLAGIAAAPIQASPASPDAAEGPARAPADDWPQFHHDAARTGATTSAPPADNTTIWGFQAGGPVNSSPAVVSGKLFFGSDDGAVYALNSSTGELLWKFQTGGPAGSPAVQNGVVYAPSADGGLHCLNEDNGTELLNISAGAPLRSPVLATPSAVVVGTESGAVVAVSPGGGALWTNFTGFPVRRAPASFGGLAFVAAGPTLWAFNLTNGDRAWNLTMGQGNLSHPTVAEGRVVVGSEERVVAAFDAVSGAPAWSTPVTGAVVASPAYSSGGLYFGTMGQCFYRLEAGNGSIALNLSAEAPVAASAAATAEAVVYASGWGLTALNSTSGALIWNRSIPGGAVSSPAVANSRAYVGTGTGTMQAFGSHHTARILAAGPSPARQGENITFNGSSPDCVPVAYQWRSSLDGPLSDGPRFNVSTMTLGLHQVGFRIQDVNWTWSEWETAMVEVLPPADWPQFGKDTSHRGSSTDAAPLKPTRVWTTNAGGQLLASPVVYRGMVFMAIRYPTGGGGLYALDMDNGTRIWSWTASTGGLWGAPACADGLIFTADDAGNVAALEADPRDGIDDGPVKDHSGKEKDIIWYTSGLGKVWGSPVVANGKVLVPSMGSFQVSAGLYALDELTGVPLWNFNPTDPNASISSSPAVEGGLVIFGSYDNRLYAVNLTTGREVWNFTTKGDVRGPPSVFNGTVFFGSDDGRLYALALGNGSKRWEYATGDAVETSPAVADGRVFFGSADQAFRALDAETGQPIWTCSTGGSIYSSAAVGGGMVFFASFDGYIYALNAASGKQVWAYSTGFQQQHGSPALVDGRLYYGSENGLVLAFGKAPDLAVSDIGLSLSRPRVGQEVTISARVTNHGSLNATAVAKISDGLPGVELSRTLIQVPVGSSVNVSANWTVGPGVHRLVVNVTDTVPYEANQEDNIASIEYVPPPQTGWTMFRSGPERTGARTNMSTPNSNEVAWSWYMGAEGHSSPVTAGSRLYQAAGNTVYAFEAAGGQGRRLWSYTAGAAIRAAPAASNLLVMHSADGAITALNEFDGSVVWTVATGGEPAGETLSSPLITGDAVYIGSGDGSLYALTLYNIPPVVLWKKALGGPVLSSPAYYPAAEVLVVGCAWGEGGRIYGIYINGTEAWNFTTPAPVVSTPAISDGIAYIGCDDGMVYALEALPDAMDDGLADEVSSSHDLLWRTNLSLYIRGDDYRVRSSPAVLEGSVYVGAGYNTIAALDALSGRVLWYRDLGSPVDGRYMLSSPAASEGRLFVGGPGLFALNPRNGATVWAYTPGSWVWSSPAISLEAGGTYKGTGAVCAVTEDGRLSVFASVVQIPPVALISSPAPGQGFRVGESILFNASASWDPDGEIVNYTWSFGDGNTSMGESVEHAYDKPGDYNITLEVTDDRGLTNATSVEISVRANSAPELRLPLVTPASGEVETVFTLRVRYYDADNDSAFFVRAIAGDQTVELAQMDPEDLDNTDGKDYACETRLLSGIFGVHFEASDGVLLNRTPVVENMTVTNQSIFSYQNRLFVKIFYAGRGEVHFNESSFPNDPNPGLVKISNEFEITTRGIDAWWWANISFDISVFNLTEVNSSTIQIYRYNFTNKNWTLGENPGLDLEKNITWINVTSLSTFAVLAQPPFNNRPVAKLGKDITIMEGETAVLNASGSSDPDGDPLTYHWDFGDSRGKAPVAGDKVAEHKYTKPGRYIVTVNVSDGRLNSTAQQTVTVKQKGSEQFVIVIVVIIVLVVAIIFMLPRGDDRKAARLKAEDDEFQKGMAVRKAKSKKAKGPPPGSKGAGEEE